jgi:hypothetical protein
MTAEPTGLDIAYDELKDSYGRLRDQETRLNTEATFILGSASIVVSAIFGILNAATHRPSPFLRPGVAVDIVLYFAAVFYASRAYTVDAVQDFNPNDFTAYLDAPGGETKRTLTLARLRLYQRSAYALALKARRTGLAAGFLLAEVLCLAVLLLLETVST